jgi:hypothetical protein
VELLSYYFARLGKLVESLRKRGLFAFLGAEMTENDRTRETLGWKLIPHNQR